jgi:hypothetical protein
MLAPLRGGGFGTRSLDTDEANVWLKEVLVAGGLDPCEAQHYGTHSLKACLLSASAKAGMRGGFRRMLGYHVKSKDSSMLEYSRDAMAEPLRQLGVILDKVYSGDFMPDSRRSGRWAGLSTEQEIFEEIVDPVPSSPTVEDGGEPLIPLTPSPRSMTKLDWENCSEAAASVTAVVFSDEDGRPDDEDSVSSGESPSDCDLVVIDENGCADVVVPEDAAESAMEALSFERAEEEDVMAGREDEPFEAPSELWMTQGVFQHKTLKTLHLAGPNEETLGCWRRCGASSPYVKLVRWPTASWHRCSTCFGSK